MKQHLLWVTKVCYRTKIVMVYLLVLKRCINFKYSIRTRIVMVYQSREGISTRYRQVFVQELLWFITFRTFNNFINHQVFIQELLWFIPNRPLRGLLVLLVFVQELLWFIACIRS